MFDYTIHMVSFVTTELCHCKQESSHEQQVSESKWLCSHKTLFTKPGFRLDLTTVLSLSISDLNDPHLEQELSKIYHSNLIRKIGRNLYNIVVPVSSVSFPRFPLSTANLGLKILNRKFLK